MKLYRSFLTALLIFVSGLLAAQTPLTVTGSVHDEKGEPLPGAAVMVKGTKTGAVTDIDGKYSIKVAGDGTLVFTTMGFEEKEIKVNNRTKISVNLHMSAEMLDAVVVNVGYGYVKKSDLTGSVSSVVMSDIADQSKASIESMLQGRVSGLQTVSSDGTPGGGMNVRIRGAASITASSEPLYVIDGFPYTPENSDQTTVMSGMTNTMSPLALINPNDIASIEVLKDASATAIYGSRAANGVILVTTKMGQEGKPRVSYNGSFGMQYVSNKMDMISQETYLDIIEVIGKTDQTGEFFDADYNIKEELRDPKAYVDWQDLIFRWGHKTDHQLSVSGGTKNTRYSASLGIYDENGTIVNSDFTRYSARMNMESNIKPWLTIGFKGSGNYVDSNGPWSGGGSGQFAGLLYKALRYRPINFDPYNPVFNPGEMIDEFSAVVSNPLVFAYDIDRKKKTSQMMFNGYVNFKICKGLTFKVTGGVSLNNMDNRHYFAKNTDIGRLSSGRADVGHIKSLSWQQESILNYHLMKKKHDFNIMAAFSLNHHDTESLAIQVKNFSSELHGADEIDMGTDVADKHTGYSMYRTVSALARASYNYDRRYYITATFREDASSRFGANNRWAGFPSVAVAWAMGREKWMAPVKKVLSGVKFRASYGWTGNQSISPYSSMALYKNGYWTWGDSGVIGYGPKSWGNDDLKWETTNQMDAGLDLEFFRGRLNIVYDFYNKKTYDMLLATRVPATTGYGSRLANVGSIRQWGHELSITGTPFNKEFVWEIGLNMSFEKNRVLSLGDTMDELVVGSNHRVMPGMPLGEFYGWQYDGLYQQEDFDEHGKLLPGVPAVTGRPALQPGDMKFKDVSGADGKPDGIVDEFDNVPIGSAAPIFYGGFTNNFSYKNFDLKIFMNFRYGNKIYNRNMENFGVPRTGGSIQNYMARVENYWTPDNTDTDIPRLCPNKADKATYYGHSVDYFLEDGSFLRIANITLGYNFPKKMLQKINMNGLRLYFSVDNPWVFTKYSGFDPEVSMSSNALTPGIDANAYPRSRVYKVGLNFNF